MSRRRTWLAALLAVSTAGMATSAWGQSAMFTLQNLRLESDGARGLIASGDVVNVGSAAAMPGRLRFLFKGQDGKPIGERLFDLEANPVPPQGRQPFRQRVEDPPPGAASVELSAVAR